MGYEELWHTAQQTVPTATAPVGYFDDVMQCAHTAGRHGGGGETLHILCSAGKGGREREEGSGGGRRAGPGGALLHRF